MAIIAYFLWSRKNDYLHNHKFDYPKCIILKATDELNLICSQAPTCPNYHSINHTASHDTCQKPPVGVLKINWDVAFDVNQERIGVRVIIRDHEGQFVGALRAGKYLTKNSFIAESMALLLAVKFCKDL